MVDNWFMEEVINDIQNYSITHSAHYAELLMAIVLWDEVYYPQNKFNFWNNVPSQVQYALQPIDDSDEKWKEESVKEFYRYKGISEEEYYWLKWKNSSLFEPQDTVNCGAIRYLMLSNNNGLDYLPCEQRYCFLQEYLNIKNILTFLPRIKLQNSLTKVVNEYYVEAYKSLIDFSSLEIRMPVLVNFIFDNARNNMSPVDFAFHLKNEGPLIKYREYLNKIDVALENQDWLELRFLLSCSEEAVNTVISMDKKRLNRISVNILPTPSIMFESSNATVNLSNRPSLTINNFERHFKKFNLTFVKDITKYAINDMRRW